MKLLILSLFLLLIIPASSSVAQTLLPTFFEGTWKIENMEAYEVWEITEDEQMKGHSYRTRDGEQVITEYLEINHRNNQLIYTATVLNQNEGRGIDFILNRPDSLTWVFENPEHDFPKMILYQKRSDSEIYVEVSDGGERGFNFHMHRVPDLIQPFSLNAQTTPDELAPEDWFDFWLGTWDLTWEDADGTLAKGSNRIERILDGQVIKEHFKALSGVYEGFEGESYSVYNSRTGEWKQTWVDSNGSYLDFTGEFEDSNRIFKREGTAPDGQDILQRMAFYDITENSFTWDWEVSEDNSNTWKLRWRIFYERAD